LIDPGETAESTARKELMEETGHEARSFELHGQAVTFDCTVPKSNVVFSLRQMLEQPTRLDAHMEKGMEPVLYNKNWKSLLREPGFYASPSCAALFAAVACGKLGL
jgi:ADP-ribose pyrophosphatase YjhB (NUDIX family)